LLYATILCLALFATATSQAQDASPDAQVDSLMVPFDQPDGPGAAVAVVQDGEIMFSNAYGRANLTHDVPFSLDTPSNIGSVSKQFTAFAILLLAERGQLSLDDDIRTHVPEVPDFGPTVTLRHLLTHTSGYRETINTFLLAGRRIDKGDYIGPDEHLWLLHQQPTLQHEPGTAWNYNNTGYQLLATVVERVTEQSFPAWMQANVFDPLGMTCTTVRSSQMQIVPNRAQGYAPAETGGFQAARDFGLEGASSIYSTTRDLARWIENLGTGALGGLDVIRAMMTPQVLADGDTTNYGFGLLVGTHRGLDQVWHGGAAVGHRAALLYYPEIDAGVITLSNSGAFDAGGPSTPSTRHASGLPAKIAGLFFQNHMGEPQATAGRDAARNKQSGAEATSSWTPSEADRTAYVGRYFSEELQTFYTIAAKDEQLVVRQQRLGTFPLTPIEADAFRVEFPAPLRFRIRSTRDNAGNVTGFTVSFDRTRGVRFEKRTP
jgi:CubicO group peptidase (beta-lactamase class C family)